jgi:uncharacterized repeat protein (TIGR03803 family)
MKTKLKLFAFIIFALAAALRVEAQKESIYNFPGGTAGGAYPLGNLTQASNGKIYGSTSSGGSSGNGILFELTPGYGANPILLSDIINLPLVQDGNLTSRTGQNGDIILQGSSQNYSSCSIFNLDATVQAFLNIFTIPPLEPTVAKKGIKPADVFSGSVEYGVILYGGANEEGIVYQVNTNGTGYVVLQDFTNATVEGQNPTLGLVLTNTPGVGDTLYGTTSYGGVNNSGTVYVLYPAFVPYGIGDTVLHNFSSFPGEANPNGGLILSGNTLFGTTMNGGGVIGSYGNGVVFSVDTSGNNYNVLHVFKGTDGTAPNGNLILSGSTLYGTANSGGNKGFGATPGGGTVFSINTNGSNFTVLYNFSPLAATNSSGIYTNSDGANPNGGMVLDGYDLLGTAQHGGTNGYGTVFEIILQSPPSLNIAPSGGSFKISWPSSATNFVLQQNANLATTNWSTNSLAVSNDGTNKSVIIISAAGNAFFRLLNTNGP